MLVGGDAGDEVVIDDVEPFAEHLAGACACRFVVALHTDHVVRENAGPFLEGAQMTNRFRVGRKQIREVAEDVET